jgi:hypothetical protein
MSNEHSLADIGENIISAVWAIRDERKAIPKYIKRHARAKIEYHIVIARRIRELQDKGVKTTVIEKLAKDDCWKEGLKKETRKQELFCHMAMIKTMCEELSGLQTFYKHQSHGESYTGERPPY